MMRVRLTVAASLADWGREIAKDLAERNTAGMRRAADLFKKDLRSAFQTAGLGRRLGNAIGASVYPATGASMSPAAIIYPRGQSAERIVRAYTEGARIRGRDGRRWLAIPVRENLPVLGRGVKPTPELVEMRLFGFVGSLRFVVPRGSGGRYGLLVADAVTRGKTGKRVTAYGRNRALGQRRSGRSESLVMFVLVREVSVRKRVDADAIAARVLEQLPRLIASAR